MKNIARMTLSILLSLIITAAYMPFSFALDSSDAPESDLTEAADDPAASGESTGETAVNGELYGEAADSETGTEKKERTDSARTSDDAQAYSPDKAPYAVSGSSGINAAADIENGTVTLTQNGNECTGTAVPDEGYDLATIRQIWTDTEGKEHEQYLDYKEDNNGTYSFDVKAAETDSVVTAYFYDLRRWDGAVDITWYDPDNTLFEISTPAQLAGLAAITNGMVDTAVTEEYMIKDNAGRYPEDGKYSHTYISTESAVADLLTPNFSDGAGQVRDTVWRLPQSEHKMIAEDDLHNDFLYRTVRLTADIDMGDKNWTPIGGKYAMNRDATGDEDPKVIDTRFQGVLDGCGHTVTINCDRMAKKGFAYAMEIALIGYLGGGVDYKNGYPKDTYMDYAKYWVPTVRNVVVRGEVKGRRMVGGVVGRTGETNYGVLVENCANFADVFATDMRGCAGIVGAAWGKTVIRNCYNAGTVRSNFWEHGGIVGSNGYEGSEDRDPAGADIYNCYNIGTTGLVTLSTDTPEYDGQEIGVDGQAFAAYAVSNCYYPEPGSPVADKTGYSIGDTSKNKKVRITAVKAADLRSDETLSALNSNGNVFIKDTEGINNGYPVLYFQGTHGSGTADVKIVQTDGGTVSSESGLTALAYGTTVDFEAVPDQGKRLTGYLIDDGVSEMIIPANGFYTVSGRSITVKGIFEDRAPSVLRFIESDDGAPYYISVEKVYDANTQSNVSKMIASGSQVNMGDVIKIKAVNINLTETQPDIKYLEYTGKFSDPAYTDRSLEVKNKAAGTYTVTGEAENIDITVSPKTQGKMWTTVADTSWYSEGKTSFTVTTARQLAGLAKLCRGGNSFDGITIKLGNDISLDNTVANSGDNYGYERSWMGVGSSERYAFKGIFDGQGHTIRYMHRNFAPGYCDGGNGGLFGVTDGAVIKNVRVEGGSYVNKLYDVTMDCAFINGATGGAIAGTAIDTLIENCSAGVDMNNAYSAGGIVGSAEGSTIIRSCKSDCNISGSSESIGGIAGKVEADGVTITDCTNNGHITTMSWKAGGILGSGESYSALIERCVNNGEISTSMKGTSSNAHAAGGIAGYAAGALKISGCINHGDISGTAKTYSLGGIAGTILRATIEDCYNTGDVRSESTSGKAQTAGIANTGTNAIMKASIRNSYNAGTVSTGSDYTGSAGGVIGYGSAATNSIENAYCTDRAVAEIGGSAGTAGAVVGESILKRLEVSIGDSFVIDRNGINDGFPVLSWQDPSASAAVTTVKAVKSSQTAIKVLWTAAGPRDGFEVYRSVNGGKDKLVCTSADLSYTDKGLTAGKKYSYKVRAYREEGESKSYGEWSETVSLKLLLNAMKLSSVKNKKTGSAEIKWKRNKAAAGYEIFRSISPKSGYKKVKTIAVTKKNKKKKTLSFVQKKLKKKKTYYYKIRYYKKVNGKKVYSELSAYKKVKIKK